MIAERIRGSVRLLALVALLLAAQCGDKSTNPGHDSGPKTPITYPLGIGNRWTYAVQIAAGQAQDTLSLTDEVVRVDTMNGAEYFALEGTPSDGGRSETTHLRQTSQSLYVYPDISFDSSPEGRWIGRQVARSFPWRLDFTGAIGRAYQFGPVDTTFESGFSLILTIATSNVGRTSLTVPDGAYSDVYQGRMTLLAVYSFGSDVAAQISSTQDLFIKDGVGLVKEVKEDRSVSAYGQTDTTRTSVLRSKDLIP